MKARKTFSILAVVLSLSFAAACGGSGGGGGGDSAPEAESGNGGVDTSKITFGAATQGGFWYVFASTLGNMMEKELGSTVAVIEGGSLANIEGIATDQFQVGLTNGQSIPAALEGFGGFDEPLSGFSGVAGLYPNVMQIVVREDSGIKSIEDLKGKRVSPGIKGYSGEVAFQEILAENGMSYDDLEKIEYLPTADGATQLRDGQLDALAIMLVTPASTISELEATVGIDILPVSDETISGLQEKNPGYQQYAIPADMYGAAEEVQTIAATSVLLVDDELPEDYVHDLTALLVESKDKWATMNSGMSDFDAEYGANNVPEVLPLHPGAEKYYEEAGVEIK
jgi:TRAP transporter TAXI family solute receptor